MRWPWAAPSAAPTSGEAVLLQARGAYNDLSLELDGTLGSFDALRDVATPFPMELHAASGAGSVSYQWQLNGSNLPSVIITM